MSAPVDVARPEEHALVILSLTALQQTVVARQAFLPVSTLPDVEATCASIQGQAAPDAPIAAMGAFIAVHHLRAPREAMLLAQKTQAHSEATTVITIIAIVEAEARAASVVADAAQVHRAARVAEEDTAANHHANHSLPFL